MTGRASFRTTQRAGLAAALVLAALIAACGGDDESPVEPDPVDLCQEFSLAPVSLGVGIPNPLDLTLSPFDAEFATAGDQFDVPP